MARPRHPSTTLPADPPADGRQWSPMGVNGGCCGGCLGRRHRLASEAIETHRAGGGGGRQPPRQRPPPIVATGSPSGRRGRQKSGMEFFFFSAKPMGLTTYAPRENLEFFSDRADSPADLTPRGGISPKSVVIFFRRVIFWKKTVIFDKKGQ